MKQVNGIWLPDEDTYFEKILLKSEEWEPEKIQAALSRLQQCRTAVDIGAHVGLYAVILADHFNRVKAFEPCAETFECLRKNTTAFGNVDCYQLALSNHTEFVTIHRDKDRSGNTGSYFVQRSQPADGQLPAMQLDELQLDAVDFIKIDVEGWEYNVLRGASETIRKWRPVLMVEEKNFKGRYSLPSARELILSFGYRLVASIRADHIYVGD